MVEVQRPTTLESATGYGSGRDNRNDHLFSSSSSPGEESARAKRERDVAFIFCDHCSSIEL